MLACPVVHGLHPFHSLVGDFIQVQATNNSAATFIFMAQITVIGSTTTATLARVFPADATTGSYSYKIMPATRTFIAYYTHPGQEILKRSGGAKIMFGTTVAKANGSTSTIRPVCTSYASSHDITGLIYVPRSVASSTDHRYDWVGEPDQYRWSKLYGEKVWPLRRGFDFRISGGVSRQPILRAIWSGVLGMPTEAATRLYSWAALFLKHGIIS